jgi:phosphoheptose isomerase
MAQKRKDWHNATTVDEIQTYQEVIKHLSKEKRKRHLLLGNGFSMAYDHKIFSYNALSRYIENSSEESLKRLFKIVNTKNFEEIMLQLNLFKEFAEVFKVENTIVQSISDTSDKLKNSLIEAIKEMHPEHIFSIPHEKLKNCSVFLSEYLDNQGCIFSTNYDLLLYWVLLNGNCPNIGDGFGRDVEKDSDEYVPDEDIEYSELRWDRNIEKQTIFYLHGALHLFDIGSEIVKEEYDGQTLLKKISSRIDRKEYPVFIMAGNAEDKLRNIRHNRYLTYCYDALSKIQDCSLITYGFSFSDNDMHIINAINKAAKQTIDSRLRSIYISVFSDHDLEHIRNIESSFKTKVNVYSAKTTNIW